jgi:lipoprotein-anchoring transpeptidase ErfK/SrfK
VKRDRPWLPDVIPPGPKNPMGARALTLNGGAYQPVDEVGPR